MDAKVSELVLEVKKLQDQREQTFFLFKRGLSEYLEDRDFQRYKLLANEATEMFQAINKDILEIKRKLQEAGREDLCELISRLQSAERNRLVATTSVHQHSTKEETEEENDLLIDAKQTMSKWAQESADILEEFNYELD
eukprot:m.162932 g.162932  ORF g.162932 m.162932 type:complete len:139 (-) comp15208_c0_seq6:6721-7137(-)